MSKKLVLAMTPNRTSHNLTVAELATAGFLSAVPTTVITGPVERAKVLLQVCNVSAPTIDFLILICRYKDKEPQSKSTRVYWTS
jgi:hypothetical protein